MSVPESKFYLWRAAVAMAHADSVVTEEEERFLESLLKNQDLSTEQREILANDLKTGKSFQELDKVFAKITHPPDRAMVLHYGRTIFHQDRDFSDKEKKVYDYLSAAIASNVCPLESLTASMQKIERDSAKENISKGPDKRFSLSYRLLKKLF